MRVHHGHTRYCGLGASIPPSDFGLSGGVVSFTRENVKERKDAGEVLRVVGLNTSGRAGAPRGRQVVRVAGLNTWHIPDSSPNY